MNTALRLVTLFVITSQVFAFGGTQLICRYTGKVMESCCCPSKKVAGSSAAKLGADSCCDARTTDRTVVAAVVQDGRGKLGEWVGIPGITFGPALSARDSLVVGTRDVRDAGPPSGLRLHLRLRQLLI